MSDYTESMSSDDSDTFDDDAHMNDQIEFQKYIKQYIQEYGCPLAKVIFDVEYKRAICKQKQQDPNPTPKKRVKFQEPTK